MTSIPDNLTISNTRAIVIYLIASLFLCFEMGIQVSPSVMSGELMRDLSLGSFGLGLMSGFYFYSYTAMQIPSGLLFDRFEPRLIITLSIVICAIGTIIFGFSNNIYFGCVARLLIGSGSAFAFVSVLVITADLFEAKYFAFITGITQMIAALGAMAGQLPVRLMVNSIGWRESMMVMAVACLILAVLSWFLVRYSRVVQTSHKSQVKVSISKSVKNIIINPQTWFIAFYACLLWAPMSGFASLWGVPYLIQTENLSPNYAAFLCSFMWLGLAVGSPVLGMISTKMNNRLIPLTGSAILGTLAFFLIWEFNLSPTVIGFLLFLAGAACAGQALSFTSVKENNEISNQGAAIAFNNMAVVISGAVFQPVIGKLLDVFPNVSNDTNYHVVGVIILSSFALASFVAMLFIRDTAYTSQK